MTRNTLLLLVASGSVLVATKAHAQFPIVLDECSITDSNSNLPPPDPTPVEADVNGCSVGWNVVGYPMHGPNLGHGYFTKLPQGTCYFDTQGNPQCFFGDKDEACDALQTMNNEIENLGTQFGPLHPDNPVPAVNPTHYNCVDANNAIRGYIDVLPMPARGDIVQTVFLSLNGSFTETQSVAGPYRNIPMPTPYTYKGASESSAKPGYHYTCSKDPMSGKTFRTIIIDANKAKHGSIKSDLANFRFPKPPSGCFLYDANNPNYCREPADLDPDGTKPNGVQLHHVIRRRTQTGCNWGKNSMQNGVLISRQLNTYFSNNYPNWDEINRVNTAPPY